MEEQALREAVVAAGARLGARGLIAAGEGNLSVRLSADRLLVTPSGRRKDELVPGDLLIVDAARDGGRSPGPGPHPTSDLAIHRAVAAARPDVLAIVHAHLPAAMALTLAGERPDPRALPETAALVPDLPLVPFGEMGSQDLADRIAAAFGANPRPRAVLLERHGAVAVGGEERGEAQAVADATDRLELVDVLCRVWLDALLVRAARSALPS